MPHAPALAVPSVNVTVVPATGLPIGVQDRDLQRLGVAAGDAADLRFSGIATILAGTPAAVFVKENETEPYCDLAVTV